MPIAAFLVLFVIAALGGLLVGLAGTGSTLVVLPCLIFLFHHYLHSSLALKMAIATTLASGATAAAISSYQHIKQGHLCPRLLRIITPTYAVVAVTGPFIAHYLPTATFHLILGVALLICSALLLRSSFYPVKKIKSAPPPRLSLIATSMCAGLLASLGGVATGVVMTPYLSRYYKHTTAIGTSVTAAIAGCSFATLTYIITGINQTVVSLPRYCLGYVYLPAYAIIAISVFITTPIGAKMSERVKLKGFKIILSAIILLSALFILF